MHDLVAASTWRRSIRQYNDTHQRQTPRKSHKREELDLKDAGRVQYPMICEIVLIEVVRCRFKAFSSRLHWEIDAAWNLLCQDGMGLAKAMLSYPPILLLGLAGERMGYSNMLPTEIYNILFLVNIRVPIEGSVLFL
jgi:hypothetical protein